VYEIHRSAEKEKGNPIENPPKKGKEIKKTKKKETENGKKTIKHGWIDFWNI
jgi:hypothetical protein